MRYIKKFYKTNEDINKNTDLYNKYQGIKKERVGPCDFDTFKDILIELCDDYGDYKFDKFVTDVDDDENYYSCVIDLEFLNLDYGYVENVEVNTNVLVDSFGSYDDPYDFEYSLDGNMVYNRMDIEKDKLKKNTKGYRKNDGLI